ncbi:MAG TPA: patatin-like phospholipase family protein [Burkholderiaceae bacterium]|nr:patatin-like phospholipase family protein [Burkholderiaceae bacterium]
MRTRATPRYAARRALAIGRCVAVVTAVAAASAAATAAEAAAVPEPQGRPRVCLVLAGGGARGAAHIGVIKALERLRVPVDCIAGTSIGALIGAAYATGIDAEEMEKIVSGLSTEALFVDRPPRSDLPIRTKIEEQRNSVGPEFGFRDGQLLVPKGLVAGVQLETMMRRLIRSSDVIRFDELPIPFRAVATDLASGEPVVLSQGELSQVLRASLSVPVALAPVRLDGRLLVDGGLTDNLPLDVARSMGADVAIVVDLGSASVSEAELGTLLGVSRRILDILVEQNEKKSLALLKPDDIVINPDLGNYSSADFDHWSTLIPLGEAAALKLQQRLGRLSLSADEYAQLLARRRGSVTDDARPIAEVRLPPFARVNPDVVRAQMQTRAGQPLQQAQLEADVRRLYAGGDFENISYALLNESGQRVVSIDAAEKSWGPNFLQFGLEGAYDLRGESRFEALAAYRRTWIDSLGAEWRTLLELGRQDRLATELYQPLGVDQIFFIVPYAELGRDVDDVFAGGRRAARYVLHEGLTGVDFGARLGRAAELRTGVQIGRIQQRLDQGPESLSPGPDRVGVGAWHARLRADEYDRLVAPLSGFAATGGLFASRTTLGGESSYTRWDVSASGAESVGASTLDLGATFKGRFGANDLPRYDVYQWGGFLQQSGYRIGSLNGQSLQFARAIYRYQLAPLPFLNGLYAGMSLEAGRLGRPIVVGGPTRTMKSASLFFLLDSPIGPLYLAYGRARDGSSSLYLYIGEPATTEPDVAGR